MNPAVRPGAPLTEKELEAVRLVHAQLTDESIALRIGKSPCTVKTHLSHAKIKLRLETRVGLALWYERYRVAQLQAEETNEPVERVHANPAGGPPPDQGRLS